MSWPRSHRVVAQSIELPAQMMSTAIAPTFAFLPFHWALLFRGCRKFRLPNHFPATDALGLRASKLESRLVKLGWRWPFEKEVCGTWMRIPVTS